MSKTRVLIVDDDVNLSRLSAMILENSGSYEVLTEKDSSHNLSSPRGMNKKDLTETDIRTKFITHVFSGRTAWNGT